MRSIVRLFYFAKPLRHYIPEFIIYTLLYTLFAAVNFTLLIPVLNLIFYNQTEGIEQLPEFSLSINYAVAAFKHYTYYVSGHYGKMYGLLLICGIIMFFSFICNLFRYLAMHTMLRLRTKITFELRNIIYEKLLAQSLSYHTEIRRGELFSIMTNDLGEIDRSIIGSFRSWLTDPVIIISYFFVLFYISTSLTLFTIFFLPLSAWVISLAQNRLRRWSKDSQDLASAQSSFTEETLNGIKIIQSYSAVPFFVKKFKDITTKKVKVDMRIFSRMDLSSPLSEFLGIIVVLTLTMFGGYLILSSNGQTLTASSFISYLAIYSQIISPIKSLGGAISVAPKGMVALNKVFSILDAPTAIQNAPSAIEKKDFKKNIVFKHVYFAYEGNKWALNNIDIEIKKGESIALIGESGSGKTTLSHIISRFYDVTKGGVYIDGTNIKNIKLDDLRSLIGYVSQESILLHDSISNNIVFSNDTIDIKRIKNSAKIAYVDSFAKKLPFGYDTHVGEKGMKLSGGQRQRITIARAIYKDAPILILDEATSALDSRSELWVQEAIEKIMKNKTSIIIAHRLSTIKHVDRIIVLDKGKIVEQGSHKDLIANKNSYYYKIVNIQKIQ